MRLQELLFVYFYSTRNREKIIYNVKLPAVPPKDTPMLIGDNRYIVESVVWIQGPDDDFIVRVFLTPL